MRYREIIESFVGKHYCPEVKYPDAANTTHNANYIELLDIAYKVYLDLGLIKGQQEFSVRIAGKAPSYLSCMKSRGRTPNRIVLVTVLNDARLLRDGIETNKHFGHDYAETLNGAHRKLVALVNTMEEQLVDREQIV